MISTQLTQIMSITCPIALAPMGGVADGTLAGATAAAGGIGFIGMSGYTPEEFSLSYSMVNSPE